MKNNENIIHYLGLLYEVAKQNKEPFKARAYDNAIKSIQTSKIPISSVEDVSSLPGIGKSIRAKIDEIIRTGKLSGMRMQKSDFETMARHREMSLLTQIHGLGPKKATELYEKRITMRNIRDHTEELTSIQKKGLRYFEDFQKRIPYDEMRMHEDAIDRLINRDMNMDTGRHYVIAKVVGSFRRKSATSGDIDVIVTLEPKESGEKKEETKLKIIKHLEEEDYLVDTFGRGSKKVIGVSRIGGNPYRRIDILFTDPETFPFSVLYFTGSASFNVALRKYALKKGYRLNEYGIVRLKSKKKEDKEDKEEEEEEEEINTFTSEKDIFGFLGLKYVEPSERDGMILDSIVRKKEKENEKKKKTKQQVKTSVSS